MNTRLLRKVQRVILREPARLCMGGWLSVMSGLTNHEGPSCGTVGCIAGWAALLDKPRMRSYRDMAASVNRFDGRSTKEQAKDALGITEEQSERLFHVGGWPAKYSEAYKNSDPDFKAGAEAWFRTLNRRRARIAAARIERFIRSKGNV